MAYLRLMRMSSSEICGIAHALNLNHNFSILRLQAVSVGVIYCILYTHYLIACLVQSQEMLTDVFNILFLASGVVKSRF